ncbi:hypothetical protein PPSIR1_38419 [Plesiocystis pacifica SIR-1]|uniref:Uncharacterized protein n=1 Tax=Plesiocystis pacifica SIR-1 TaxID=391625 RepID=A6G8K7_9BACT|nr:hypothetical protein PPSIR1_38419 [Plesiocystis pacifica SIR-1]
MDDFAECGRAIGGRHTRDVRQRQSKIVTVINQVEDRDRATFKDTGPLHPSQKLIDRSLGELNGPESLQRLLDSSLRLLGPLTAACGSSD